MWTNSKQGKTIQGQAQYLDMTPGASSCVPAYIHSPRAVHMKSTYARTAPALKARWHSRTQANTRIRVCGIFELKPYLKYGKPYSTRTSSTEKIVLKYGKNRTQLRKKPYSTTAQVRTKPYSTTDQAVPQTVLKSYPNRTPKYGSSPSVFSQAAGLASGGFGPPLQ